jgi:hypothetical protein
MTILNTDEKPALAGEYWLERQAAPDALVRLWLKPSLCEPGRYLALVNQLLRAAGSGGAATSAYRFVGACRERKAGVDYVCMSFCVERDRRRGASSAGRLAID